MAKINTDSLLNAYGDATWSARMIGALSWCSPAMLDTWVATRLQRNVELGRTDTSWSVAREIRERMITDNQGYMPGMSAVMSKCVAHVTDTDYMPLALACIGMMHPDFKSQTVDTMMTDAWHLLMWWQDYSKCEEIIENIPWMIRDSNHPYLNTDYLPEPSQKMAILLSLLAPDMSAFDVLSLVHIMWTNQPDVGLVLNHDGVFTSSI